MRRNGHSLEYLHPTLLTCSLFHSLFEGRICIRFHPLNNALLIVGNKFLYFMLAALGFFVITVIANLFGDDEITEASAYSMLILPCVLLVFYPMCFGLQNDQDAKIVEIIFGIPNYSYKVWLLRLVIAYLICFIVTFLLAVLTNWLIVSVPPLKLALQTMVPALFIGTLSFFLSTAIKNGNGTSVVNALALTKGADILRVHDVKPAVEAVKIVSAMNDNTTF